MASSTLLAGFPGGNLGRFSCPAGDTLWDCDVSEQIMHVFAFPSSPVWITFAGDAPILADRSQVMLHRMGQVYQRSSVAGNGDYCRFIALTDDTVREMTAGWDQRSADEPIYAFGRKHTEIDPNVYAAFLTATSSGLADGDGLRVAEACLLASEVIVRTASLHNTTPARLPRQAATARRDLVEAAKSLIATDVANNWSLDALARRLHVSPYHLTRSFRRVTGVPLHRYLTDVRLRTGLDLLLGADESTVTTIAHRLGFASHAHFTTSFRTLFGMTPSQARAITAAKSSKILEAATKPAL